MSHLAGESFGIGPAARHPVSGGPVQALLIVDVDGGPMHERRCYDAGPATVTSVPIGVRGHVVAASGMAISTHPLLCGLP